MGIIADCGLIKEVSMFKFKFNYLQNTLSLYQAEDIWHQIPEEKYFEGNFGSSGFKLSPGYITFTVYENKIRVFYKQVDAPAWFTYYRKDLPKDCPVIFEFTEQDEVEKINGKWVRRKHG